MSEPQYDQQDANNYYIAKENRELRQQRDMLRAALAGLIGVSTREELEQMEVFIRCEAAPAQDKANIIDAIHALIATLEVP